MGHPTAEELSALIAGGERADVEFKTGLADNRRIVETIPGMATIGGGTILVGVRDDGRTAGASFGRGEVERLVQQILAHTDPKIYVDASEFTLEGKGLLHIAVPPGDGPHLAFGRAFYRTG